MWSSEQCHAFGLDAMDDRTNLLVVFTHFPPSLFVINWLSSRYTKACMGPGVLPYVFDVSGLLVFPGIPIHFLG